MENQTITKKDMIQILGVIAAAYPNMRDITDVTVNIWYRTLKDLNLKAVHLAVEEHIINGIFPPSVAEIRKAAVNMTKEPITEKTEAWGLVQEAIRRYGYGREAEALASLPPEVAKTAKAMGWREICHSQKPDVVRGQFLKMYDSIAARIDKDRNTTPALAAGKKQMLEATKQLSESFSMDIKELE